MADEDEDWCPTAQGGRDRGEGGGGAALAPIEELAGDVGEAGEGGAG
jgi:hypothetical protein